MDSETSLVLVGILGALLGAGAVLAWRVSERVQTTVPDQPAPTVPPGVDAVLSVLRSSAVVVGPDDAVLRASAPTYSLGIISGDHLAHDGLLELVRRVRRDGEVREADLDVPTARSAQPLSVQARVAPLSSRLVLVLVDDRTRERQVEEIRRDFVANVSHELKTPAGALRSLAEAVGEARDDPEAIERFAGRMQRESERLTRLVQQIIELSRLQGDALLDEPVEVDVRAVLTAAADASATDAERKDIELVTGCDRQLYVLGNPEQVRAAVSNLVENAVTYSPDHSRVAVIARRDGDQVQVTVSDQGIGIPGAELDRIFERFYRVDPARARSTGGTGLGLSIVKHVAASHGGAVTVWSEPGQGSSFTLTLPAHANTIESESLAGSAGPTPQEARP